MKAKHLFRGIFLPDKKQNTSEKSIQMLPAVKEVIIPLLQHIGVPATPVVQVGQRVKKGELIACKQGHVCANVHTSICGTVSAITTANNGHGTASPAIVITADGIDDTSYMPPLVQPTADAIIERIEWAGIVGMGGAGFPTHVKLRPNKKVDTLLLNGAECEPYLTCDDRLMVEQTDKIVRGAKYLAKALGAQKIIIGIEQNKPQAITLFEQTDIPVITLKKRYPMGSERHFVYALTGRKIPLRKLPAEVGVTVQNIATAFAVCEAIEQGKPLIERVVTLSGEGVVNACNLLCPIGTSIANLLQFTGKAEEKTAKLVLGGPMTGAAISDYDIPICKTTSGVLLLSSAEINTKKPTPCINCGKCASVCPMKLMPMQIEFYGGAKEYQHAEKYGGVLSCIQCGCCSYVCPARRPLSQAIQDAKTALKPC